MIVRDGRKARTRPPRLPAALLAAVLLITFGTGFVSAAGWHTETVDSTARVGFFTSMALDSAGNPRISYFDDTNADLKYAWRDASGWHTQTVDSAGTVGWYTSLALDGAGNPRISYYDSTNADLKYAWRDGTGWHTQVVDSAGSVGGYSSLALDGAGNPRISYYDYTSTDLKYAWWDASGWHTEFVDRLGITGWWTSLALDSAGNPRISYLFEWSDDLKYAWRDGAGWHTETVDAEGYTGKCSSLAVDGAGNPRISYFDDSDDMKDDLKYAWRDGAGWHIETVDAEGWVGWYTSLALDGAGNPGISYFDDSNDDLKYAWRDGAGWHSETVDAEGATGMWTSLALASDGSPRICYLDYGNGDLKYACPDTTPSVCRIPGAAAAPTDTDGDGVYDDPNGNGRKDFADVILFFNQMSWCAANEPNAAFDYNANGRIDFADVIWLFNHVGSQAATPTPSLSPTITHPSPTETYPTPTVTPPSTDTIAAGFTATPESGGVPLVVRFASTSTGPYDTLDWTIIYGDEIVDTMIGDEPIYAFTRPNTYTVLLEASNASTQETSTAERTIVVTNATPAPTPTITPTPAVTTPVTVTPTTGAGEPYPSVHTIPGIVQAEDYDTGAYSDTTAANEGGVYRVDAVDIELIGSNYNVGWIRPGESLNYSVDTAAGGSFTLSLRVANPEAITKAVTIYLDGVPAGQVRIDPTGDWLKYREFSLPAPLALAPGRHVVTISFAGINRLNFDWLRLT